MSQTGIITLLVLFLLLPTIAIPAPLDVPDRTSFRLSQRTYAYASLEIYHQLWDQEQLAQRGQSNDLMSLASTIWNAGAAVLLHKGTRVTLTGQHDEITAEIRIPNRNGRWYLPIRALNQAGISLHRIADAQRPELPAKTLGISYEQIMKVMSHVVPDVTPDAKVDGLPTYSGVSRDKGAILSLTGDKSDLSKAAFGILFYPDMHRDSLTLQLLCLSGFLQTLFPEWEHNDLIRWITTSQEQVTAGIVRVPIGETFILKSNRKVTKTLGAKQIEMALGIWLITTVTPL